MTIINFYVIISLILTLPALKLNCSTATLPTFVYSELAPKYTNLSDVTFGSNVTYTCKAGFHRIVGENDTVICGNGTWIYNKDSCGRMYLLCVFLH